MNNSLTFIVGVGVIAGAHLGSRILVDVVVVAAADVGLPLHPAGAVGPLLAVADPEAAPVKKN